MNEVMKQKFYDEIKDISHAIAQSENKVKWDVPSLSNIQCYLHSVGSELHQYFILPTNWFKALILEEKIVDAVKKQPNLFNSKSTFCVLKGIHDSLYEGVPCDNYHRIISGEQFAYMGKFEGDSLVRDRILRLELFRLTDQNDTEFIGGLFHAFRHFNVQGCSISTLLGENRLPWIHRFLTLLANAFLFSDLNQDDHNPNIFITKVPYKEHSLKFVFYYNDQANVYFLNTAYVEDSRSHK